MDMQLHKLEFEIKLQKLTNELQELKRASSAGRSRDPGMHQSPLERAVSQTRGDGHQTSDPLERAVSQARGDGHKTSDLLAFPVLRSQTSRIELDNIRPWSSK